MSLAIHTITTDLLQRLEPLSSLAPDQLKDLIAQATLTRMAAGTVLFRAGERDGKALYLLRGTVLLRGQPPNQDQTLDAGSTEARHPLAMEQPRQVTAEALSEVEVLRIDNDHVETLLTWGQLAAREPEIIMTAEGVISIDKGNWLQKMQRSATFRNLPPANIEQLLDRMEPVQVKMGDVIIRQGDLGDYFYMINEGTAMVTRVMEDEATGEESIEIAELKEGTSFGEAALISEKPRNATVSMITDGVLLRLSKEDFLRLLKEPSLQPISYADAQRRIGQDALWLDVRMTSEYAHAHLPGALNLPVPDIHRHVRELDRDKTYICCCDSGKRSSAAAFILSQYNIKTCVLQGGLQLVPHEALVLQQP